MRFPVSSAALNQTEHKTIVQVGTYESIKAKIDRGINRQSEGRKEVQDGLREMIETKAYLKKYKTIAAFAEHEYGRSKNWVYEQLKALIPENECEKGLAIIENERVLKNDSVPDKEHNEELDSLTNEEEEKPAVHSADEKTQEQSKPRNNGKSERPPIDLSGCVVPQRLLPIRDRINELIEAEHWASKLKRLFERLQNEADPLYAHLKASGNIQTFMNGAATMYHTISKCMPDVVCPQCGAKSDNCHYCFGSGWISEVTWNREWVKSNDRLKQAEVDKRSKNL